MIRTDNYTHLNNRKGFNLTRRLLSRVVFIGEADDYEL